MDLDKNPEKQVKFEGIPTVGEKKNWSNSRDML